MRTRTLSLITLIVNCLFGQNIALEQTVRTAMAGKHGTCIFMNCNTDEIIASDTVLASERMTPCSTFKIWNTLIGAECGIISDPDALFYKWDGVSRFRPAWNKDQTLREAFRVSCVPAFQQLARKIGKERMTTWIETIGYGDKDISSGVDDFWLPVEGKKSIIISPNEQALLIKKLVNGKLPFSDHSLTLLKEIMLVKKTANGSFYGKTGSGTNINGNPKLSIGWYVGYIVSKDTAYTFACIVTGEKVSGNDSKEIIESILIKNQFL